MADSELTQLAKTDRNPSQESRYRELLAQSNLPYYQGGNATNTAQFNAFSAGQGGGGGVTGGGNYIDLAKQLYELSNQFRQPALETLRTSGSAIPGIYGLQRGLIEAEKAPLETRYQNLMADVTKTTREGAAKEYTARGIPLSSGLVEQTVGTRLAPQVADIGYQKEAGLRGLTALESNLSMSEAQQQQQLAQAVATIQSASAPEAISGGLNLYQMAQNAIEAANQRELAKWQTGEQTTAANKQLDFQQQQAAWEQPWQEKLWQYALGKPYSGTGTGSETADWKTKLDEIFGSLPQ